MTNLLKQYRIYLNECGYLDSSIYGAEKLKC